MTRSILPCMGTDCSLSCQCGTVRGTAKGLSRANAQRVVCYCDSCRTYALRLGRGGDLDALGGTPLVQTTSGRLAFETGTDRLACIQQNRRRGVYRWLATCCGSPLATSAPSRFVPLIGLTRSALGAEERELEEALGPVMIRAFSGDVAGDVTALGPGSTSMAALTARCARISAVALLRGEHRRSPFFGPRGWPVSEPNSDEALAALRRAAA